LSERAATPLLNAIKRKRVTNATIEVEEISGIAATTFTNEDITPIGRGQYLFRFRVGVECLASFNTASEEWCANKFKILGDGPGKDS